MFYHSNICQHHWFGCCCSNEGVCMSRSPSDFMIVKFERKYRKGTEICSLVWFKFRHWKLGRKRHMFFSQGAASENIAHHPHLQVI